MAPEHACVMTEDEIERAMYLAGVKRAAKGTDLTALRVNTLAELTRHFILSPRRMDQEFAAELNGKLAHWQWLEEWEERFRIRGAPAMWKQIGIQRIAEREPQAISKLFAHTCALAAFAFRDVAQFNASPDRASLKLLADDGTECPRERELAVAFNEGRIRDYPPFFPGDRTTLVTLLDD